MDDLRGDHLWFALCAKEAMDPILAQVPVHERSVRGALPIRLLVSGQDEQYFFFGGHGRSSLVTLWPDQRFDNGRASTQMSRTMLHFVQSQCWPLMYTSVPSW